MKRLICTMLTPTIFLLSGCGSSKLSTLPVMHKEQYSVQTIALAPEGGLLAEAVGIELSNRGYIIIDSTSTSKLLIRLNIGELEVANPQALQKLKEKGIDAYLTVKSAGAYDGQVQGASARATSTHSGKIIAGISWQNGWGGMAGSPADRMMRKGLAEAAQEIGEALSESLPISVMQ